MDLMKYVYIHEDDYDNYIGHHFYNVDGEMVTLDYAEVVTEYIDCYEFPSVYHLNFIISINFR